MFCSDGLLFVAKHSLIILALKISIGDSGGPLFDAQYTQVGIVSYGIGCARPSEVRIFWLWPLGLCKQSSWNQFQPMLFALAYDLGRIYRRGKVL